MLRNFQKESILLSPQRSPIVDSPAASKSPCRNANPDIDFNDVFGGPPRRASLQNARRSFGEDPFGGDDDTTSSRNRWSGLYEKPVFGEHEGGTSNRVRYQAGDFFDDIFGGNDSLGSSSSPRRIINGSPASSRVLSPARPLPARADPLGSFSSLPAPFSLPSKLTKGGTDLPTFGSNSRSYIEGKESGPSSSMISSNYSFSPLSRSSSKQDLVETEADELSMAKQHPDVTFQNPKGGGSQVKSSGGGGHFHFSIYKWASHGAPPLSKPLRGGSRSRDNKYTSSSASEVSVEPEITTVEEVKQPDSEYLKPLRSTILSDSDSERGSGTGERAREKDLREIKGVKSSSKVSALFNASHRKPEAELEETQGKSKAKGKVKDFVKIFNLQEATPDVKDQMQRRSTKKERRSSRAMDDDIKVANEKMKLAPEDKNINLNASYVQVLPQVTVDQIEKQPAVERGNSYRCYEAEGISVAPAEVSDASEATVGDQDEPFQVRELPQQMEDEKQLPAGDNSEELKANDAKIRKWCQGKEGNIRSLLSTLQYILWKGSGWKPVALVDIIEGNAVKRTYQRALLCLHPDKLQQKGATGEQRFIAEKVFDILQEAWIHFNSLGSVV
ncbi:J domain-containing protein required for chloroplast accumulation response 1 [Linum perenne]